MRRPLRVQILAPVLGVMLVTVLCVTLANAWLAARRTQVALESQLREVAHTLVDSTFPLTDAVLRQTRGLSGAEFAVFDEQGETVAASRPQLPSPADETPQAPSQIRLDRTVSVERETYFLAVVERKPRPGAAGERLHIYYPERQWRRTWREAVFPPLVVGAVAIFVMGSLATWLARRFTLPIIHLRTQVEQIAKGDFRPMALPPRDDEIRDLAASVNLMTEKLARYEAEIRRRERLRTLGQLGGGIAHQMRNAATGCRMALDLHRRRAPQLAEDENLVVAMRQLELMETYLRRFLTLGSEHAPPNSLLDLGQVVDHVLALVCPTAAHLGVVLRYERPTHPILVRGDENGLSQLIVNLTLNAIEAVSSSRRPTMISPSNRESASVGGDNGSRHSDGSPLVEVLLSRDGNKGSVVQLSIVDTGPGPALAVQDRMFEPLITDKPDGAGLGLPVAQEIAQLHGGALHWERRLDRTHFVFELPAYREEEHVAVAGG